MATLQNTTINSTDGLIFPSNSTSTAQGLAKMRINTANGQNTLEFADGNYWRPVTGYSQGVVGTGGQTIAYNRQNIVHMFTSVGSGTFTPSFTGNIQVLIVGGGGGAGNTWGGGGGGGGVVYQRNYPVTAGTPYPVNVGGGGSNANHSSGGGGSSTFNGITASGGGGGGSWTHSSGGGWPSPTSGQSGASGGGGSNTGDGTDSRIKSHGGLGIAGQGFPGGSGVRYNAQGDNCHQGGGGGGAGGPGGTMSDTFNNRRNGWNGDSIKGGPGMASNILGQELYWGGGGGGGAHIGFGYASGGIGGGGGGSSHHTGPYGSPASRHGEGGGQALNRGYGGPADGTQGHGVASGWQGGVNTGGGGGGGCHGHAGGGSGIVVIKY